MFRKLLATAAALGSALVAGPVLAQGYTIRMSARLAAQPQRPRP